MSLENEIKQKKPFRSEKEKALVNILFTYNWLNDKLKAYFKPYSITPTQYNILRILNGADRPLSTFEIRERMLNKTPDITRLIKRLIKKNYVLKEIHSIDKRLVDIAITDGGKKLLSIIETENKPIGSLMDNLTPEEARSLNRALDKIRQEL